MPPTPYRESVDAFWSQETTNDWVDRHSPHKLQQLVREFEEPDIDTSDIMPRSGRKKHSKPPSKTALRKAETEKKKAALARRKSFDGKKASLARSFLNVLDEAVSGGQVLKLAEEAGGVRITWSKTLLKTAGRAHWKRDRSSLSSSSSGQTSTRTGKHQATIELAERVIDNDDRLINTLAHEYCHLANFMVSNIHDNPHGASFKQWGRRCEQVMKDHPIYGGRIHVTTKHSYKIDYKYVWSCVDCEQTFGRHSKSIDTNRLRCGRCKGRLEQIQPKPRNVSPKKQPAGVIGQKKTVDDDVEVLGEVCLSK